ncbi:MAG: hypothetical protein ACOH1R_01225 [Luteimonas sp.]
MRSLHPLMFTPAVALALLFGCALPAFAQDAATKPAIESQMTPQQFKAAGLDKLSSGELANLNAWLNHTIIAETTKAAVQAKSKVETENRGFFSFGSFEPIVAKIAGEFTGFGKNKVYTLDNGQQWRQTDTASLAGVRVNNAGVRITPGKIGNVWYMKLDGYNTRAKVERVQ